MAAERRIDLLAPLRSGRSLKLLVAHTPCAMALALCLVGCGHPIQPQTGSGAVLMLAFPETDQASAPLADADCRLAVFTALDRRSFARAASGEGPGAWEPAFTLSSSALASFDPDYRQYPDGEGGGDLEAARAALRACGQPDGFVMRIDVPPGRAAMLDALQAGLARVGITVASAGAQDQPFGASDAEADAVLMDYRPLGPGVPAYFGPLVDEVAVPGSAMDQLLKADTFGDAGLAREQGRMLDRMLLSTLRYAPLAVQRSVPPAAEVGDEEVDLQP